MKKILVALAVLLVVCVVGLLMMAIDQIAGFAGRFHPVAGEVMFWAMMALVAGAALFALFEYYRLPVALAPPVGSSEDEQQRYVSLLRKRLKANPRFRTERLESIDEIHSALNLLQVEADVI